ncbi:MFS transporter [soil metagenome]
MPVLLSRPGRPSVPASAPGGFYGWRMVWLAAICLAMTAPGQTVGVSVFVDPMIEGLSLSRSQVSLAYLIGTLTGAMTLPAVGLRIDRLGVRRVTLVIVGGFGAVLIAMAGVAGFVTLMFGFVGIRMLGQGALTLTASTSVTLWFDRRRGLAVGMSNAGGQALMSLAPLALAAAIALAGWRGAWVVAGITVWAVVLPVAWWGLRDSPAQLEQQLDGRPELAGQPPIDPGASWTRAEALRTPMFWVLTAAVSAIGMIGTGLAFHQISLLGEQGLSVAQAAGNFIPQTAAAIAATLGMGVLIDRILPRLLISGAMAALAGAMVLAQVAAPGWRAIAFGMTVGAAGGALRSLETAAFPRYYGLANVGSIRGLVMSVNVAASAFGPLALALGRDVTGSYGPALNLLLPIPVLIAAAALVVRPPEAGQLAAIRQGIKIRAEG